MVEAGPVRVLENTKEHPPMIHSNASHRGNKGSGNKPPENGPSKNPGKESGGGRGNNPPKK